MFLTSGFMDDLTQPCSIDTLRHLMSWRSGRIVAPLYQHRVAADPAACFRVPLFASSEARG
jgi:hypothetical protein